MLLDIIIPQYSEDEKIIKNLLTSIDSQKQIDFNDINITIVNDYSNTLLSSDCLKTFTNLKITYLRNEKNTGPGLARQKGIDNTSASYIMFIDSDDVLDSNLSLFVITDFLKKNDIDYLVTDIKCEVIKSGKLDTIIKQNKETFPWMHGKVYKREFLKSNEIRFHECIRHLEDSYFTMSVLGVADPKRIAFINYPTILWKLNPNSLTRKNTPDIYTYNIFSDMYNTPFYIYEYLSRHNSKLRFNYFISSIFGLYIILNSSVFDSHENKKNEYLNKLEKDIKNKKNIFILYNKLQLLKLYNDELKELKDRLFIRGIKVSFDDFYNKYIL